MNFLTSVLENFILEIEDLEVIYVYHVPHYLNILDQQLRNSQIRTRNWQFRYFISQRYRQASPRQPL
jgi:hypothetical protein